MEVKGKVIKISEIYTGESDLILGYYCITAASCDMVLSHIPALLNIVNLTDVEVA